MPTTMLSVCSQIIYNLMFLKEIISLKSLISKKKPYSTNISTESTLNTVFNHFYLNLPSNQKSPFPLLLAPTTVTDTCIRTSILK